MPKISALPLAVTPTGDDVAVIVQGGVTKKATLASLPIQSAAMDALALKAPLASPAFTGTPTGPTAATTTSTTQFATTAFVQQELLAGGSTARSLVVSVRNQSGGTMVAGTVVYINGATGNLPTIAKAIATSDTTSAQTIGLVQTSIANNGTGLVVVRGVAGNLDTSALTEGQQLYLSPSVAGTYTTTKQFAPNHLVYIGVVTRAHPTLGSIEVVVQNGYEMEELHNVSAQSPTNGDTLRWNSATSLWEKSALGTLATQSGTFSGTSSGTNTGDQTITLTSDVTGTGTGSFSTTIAANVVTNAKLAQVATQTFKGRTTAATGNVEDLTVAQAKTLLNLTGTNSGDQTITLTGDVTGTGTGSFAATIAANAVTNAKVAQIATQTFKGRNTAATGNVEDLSVATVKTMLAIDQVTNTSDANKPVSTAQQTALNLKADLASPTFTGDPKAPTPATTDSDTSLATTAMVQAVQQAGWTQPTAIAISAAGNSNVAAATAQNRYLTQRVNVTAFTGTATVTLQNTSALAGDKRRFIVAMPAGFSNLIELRNLTSGGTLLATVPMDGALARTWLGYSTFDGTNWGAVSFSPMSVDEFVMSRTAFRGDYINSDGATSNRAAGVYGPFDAVNNPREWIAGAASLTIAAVVTIPVSDNGYIMGWAPTTSGTLYNQANTFWVSFGPSSLEINQSAAGAYVNYRSYKISGFRAARSGQTGLLKIYLVNGTTDPVVSWNGVVVSGVGSITGTPPNWLDSGMTPTYRLVATEWLAGPAPIVTPILGQTSAADDAFYMATGKWPAWVVAGGSNVSYKSNTFNSEHAGWVIINSSTITDNAGYVTFGALTANGSSNRVQAVGAANLNAPVIVSFEYRKTGGSGNIAFSIGSVPSTDTGYNGTTDWSEVADTSGSFVSRSFLLRNQGTGVQNLVFFGSAATYDVRNFSLKNQGALSLPAVQPISVIDYVSGIGGNQGRLLGCAAVTDKRSTRILGRINAASATNQQILGGALLPVPLNHAHEFVDVECDGSVTLSLGDGTTATRYTASTALTAGRTRIALTTPFAADSAKTGLYVNVTVAGGTYAQFSILGHLLK